MKYLVVETKVRETTVEADDSEEATRIALAQRAAEEAHEGDDDSDWESLDVEAQEVAVTKKYRVSVDEEVYKMLTVEATSEREAVEKVKDMVANDSGGPDGIWSGLEPGGWVFADHQTEVGNFVEEEIGASE